MILHEHIFITYELLIILVNNVLLQSDSASSRRPIPDEGSLHAENDSSLGGGTGEPEVLLNEVEDNEVENESGRVILSVFRGGGKFGAATYDTDTAEVLNLQYGIK